MVADPNKPKKILVVHGVHSGNDETLTQDQDIKNLIMRRLNGLQIPGFETAMYRYEKINQEALDKLKGSIGILTQALLDERTLTGSLADAVYDVVLNLENRSVANEIRQGLMKRILEIYEEGNPLYLVAHSLGTIYSFDAVNQLIDTRQYFDPNNRRTWPVQALVTLGSPIGLSMFKRNSVQKIGEGENKFCWINIWDRTDPVVSGSFYGRPEQGYRIAEDFKREADCGWFIQDRSINTGHAWLKAHLSYWNDTTVGNELINMLAGIY